ncbi:HNH endonuclease signature motif containing protein [Agromyces humatus]|uniref:HNH nuclease domain-containing protein n=1 Tax=Agromyces humatus TaxID=279573 RepID=A0ABP4WT30_9MICO|nr:HNH endonuclease signature motif containing protein [Agromyces humatus]
MSETLPDFAGITGALRGLGLTPARFHAADDAGLVGALEAISVLRHEVERHQALAAAEVARRSRAGFGQQSLARRDGHTSTGAMLQSITRSTKRDTAALVAVGEMVAEAEAAAEFERMRRDDPGIAGVLPETPPPWFAPLSDAVVSGELTVAVADAIRSGLGEPGGDADEEQLGAALGELIPLCRDANADAARRAARQARDRIDAAGVTARAERQQEQQFWRVWVKPDGMVRGEFELEPVTGMLVKAVFDQLTHPRLIEPNVRRGFSDPVRGDRAFADARTTRERHAADGLVELLRAGTTVDPSRLLNAVKPSVRIVVNEHTLTSGHGSGVLEGHPDRIPIGAIHTGLCEGYLPVRFDQSGACVDLGRDERLFTTKQKTLLAIRDGGCMDPDCTRPPSWTEAHHIDHWHRDNGRTDLADGILLCRRDHLRYHNEGWQIRRHGTTYWLIPPPGIDPHQTPRLMRPKTPADITHPVNPAQLPPPATPPTPATTHEQEHPHPHPHPHAAR